MSASLDTARRAMNLLLIGLRSKNNARLAMNAAIGAAFESGKGDPLCIKNRLNMQNNPLYPALIPVRESANPRVSMQSEKFLKLRQIRTS